jgi:hypothetical protein
MSTVSRLSNSDQPARATLVHHSADAVEAGRSFRALAGARTALEPREAAHHLARAWQRVTGQPPSSATLAVLWAQWALETGRGSSMHGFNFGGLKGTAARGGSASFSTFEGHGDRIERMRCRFRTYGSPSEGAEDYVETLANDYPRAFAAARRGDPAAFVTALSDRGYFSADPASYRAAIGSLWSEFQAGGGPEVDARTLVVEAPNPAENAVIWAFARAIARRHD